MADPEKRRPSGPRDNRPREERGAASGAPRPRTPSSESLRELAEELEEHGRALLARARELQRMAGGGGGSSRERPGPRSGNRPERKGAAAGGRSGERRGGERDRPRGNRTAEGGERSRRSTGEAPDWAPTPRRRKT